MATWCSRSVNNVIRVQVMNRRWDHVHRPGTLFLLLLDMVHGPSSRCQKCQSATSARIASHSITLYDGGGHTHTAAHTRGAHTRQVEQRKRARPRSASKGRATRVEATACIPDGARRAEKTEARPPRGEKEYVVGFGVLVRQDLVPPRTAWPPLSCLPTLPAPPPPIPLRPLRGCCMRFLQSVCLASSAATILLVHVPPAQARPPRLLADPDLNYRQPAEEAIGRADIWGGQGEGRGGASPVTQPTRPFCMTVGKAGWRRRRAQEHEQDCVGDASSTLSC